jgi:type IV pilus assembly protein PilA
VRLIHSLQSRRDREEGFTLIELMVVVLIIAILIAIAIPTFLGARERAQDSAAKSDLRNALAAAKVHYTDTEDYSSFDDTALLEIEPSLTDVVGDGDLRIVSTAVDSVCMERDSKSGKTFFVEEVAVGASAGTTGPEEGTC